MKKEMISRHQIVCIIALYFIGSSITLGATELGQDTWISFLLSMVYALPVLTIYARIIKLYPEKGFFDAVIEIFGKIVGKFFVALITIYAIHLGALVIRNFTEFTQTLMLNSTPLVVMIIMIAIVAIYFAKSGIETMAKWSSIIFPFIIFTVTLTIVLAGHHLNPSNLFPILEHSPKQFFASAFNSFEFPFGEVVILLALTGSFKKEDSPYKIFYYGIMAGGIALLAAILRNIMILGTPFLVNSYYPSYIAARIINIGTFLARIEGIISVNFLFAGLTKITVCLLAATKGISTIFEIKNDKKLIVPVGALIICVSLLVYNSALEMFGFLKYYSVYAFPFQVIIPVIVWITAEIKAHSKKPANYDASQAE